MSGQIQLTGNVSNSVKTVNPNVTPLVIPLPILSSVSQALASGANTINIPVGSTAMLITTPNQNTVKVTLKGVTGDTGIPISPAGWTFIAFDTVNTPLPTTFCLTAASAIATFVDVTFF
jgi:hypothetical protein